MNVLAYVEAILRGPKGVHRRCRWLRCNEYMPGSLVPVTLPEMLPTVPGEQLVTVTVRVTTPKGWGVCLPVPPKAPADTRGPVRVAWWAAPSADWRCFGSLRTR